jgi:acetyltransferase-like isoleucine patch superfamily enzyme
MFFRLLRLIQGFIKVKFFNRKHVICEGRIKIAGSPILFFRNGSKAVIGDNVFLNSDPMGYHTNMHSPVKLIADGEKALIKIGENTRIHGSCIHAFKSVTVGSNCLIGANCQIFDSNGHKTLFQDVESRKNSIGLAKKIVIEDNVWIGINSIILPGVQIGYGSVISAGSVVKNNIQPMCIAGGNPAKVIKTFKER